MDSRDTHSEPHSCAAEFLPTPTLQNIYWWSIIETAMGKKKNKNKNVHQD